MHVVSRRRRARSTGRASTADDVTVVLLGAARRRSPRRSARCVAAGRAADDPGRGHRARHHHRAAHRRHHASARSPPRRWPTGRVPGARRRRRTCRPARARCRGSRPSRCSAGGCWCRAPRSRPASLSARLRALRRGARGGADHLGRAAAHPAADGAAVKGLVDGPLRVGRLHLGQRGAGGAGEVRGVRPRRPRLLRPQDRRRRRASPPPALRDVGHRARPGARRASSPPQGLLERLAAVRRGARPDQPGVPAARRHRHRDPGRRAASTSAGRSTTSRPTAPCGPPRRRRRSARRSRPAGSTRSCSPRPRRCATWSASPASRTPSTVIAVHRPGHGQDRRGARPAGRRPRARGLGARRWSRRSPTTARLAGASLLEAGEPVVRPSASAAPSAGAGPRERRRARRARPGRPAAAAAPHARRCAGWSPRPGCTRPSWCCRCSCARASTSRGRSASMPGVVQHTRESLRKAAREAVEAGVGGLMLFGVPERQGRRAARAPTTRTASSTSPSRDVRGRGRRRARR